MGWGGRWVGGSGWGTHVYPWLIHVNVYQKQPQYCEVISLQLKFKNKEKKETACQYRSCKRHGFDPYVRKIPWRRKWQSTPVFLPGKFHGQRSLVSYTPWGHKESHMTAIFTFRVSYRHVI